MKIDPATLLLYFGIGLAIPLIYQLIRYPLFGKRLGEDNPPFWYFVLFYMTVAVSISIADNNYIRIIYWLAATAGNVLVDTIAESIFNSRHKKS